MIKEDNMTAANLRSAFGGESMAYMRYTHWGNTAKKEGFPNVDNLFKAIAYAEEVHAQNHFDVHKAISGDQLVPAMGGFGVGTTSQNLQGAIEGEMFEVDQMYATYLVVAQHQNEKDAYRTFNWAREVEKIHAELFQKAKGYVDGGQDHPATNIYVCQGCGFTIEDNPPEICPVCGAKTERFKPFTAS